MRPIKRFFLLALTLLTACALLAEMEQPGTDLKIPLSAENSTGQTFVASYDGLNGFEIRIRANAQCTLRYLLSPDSAHRLSIDEITLEPSPLPVTIRLPFDVRVASAQESFWLSIETDCLTPFTLRAAPGITYLNGSVYQNGEPLPDAQLAFRLVYHPDRVWIFELVP